MSPFHSQETDAGQGQPKVTELGLEATARCHPHTRPPHPTAPELGGQLRLMDEEAGLGRHSPRGHPLTDWAEQGLCPRPPFPPQGEGLSFWRESGAHGLVRAAGVSARRWQLHPHTRAVGDSSSPACGLGSLSRRGDVTATPRPQGLGGDTRRGVWVGGDVWVSTGEGAPGGSRARGREAAG